MKRSTCIYHFIINLTTLTQEVNSYAEEALIVTENNKKKSNYTKGLMNELMVICEEL